jgi:hypothetical protein
MEEALTTRVHEARIHPNVAILRFLGQTAVIRGCPAALTGRVAEISPQVQEKKSIALWRLED